MRPPVLRMLAGDVVDQFVAVTDGLSESERESVARLAKSGIKRHLQHVHRYGDRT